MRKEGMVAWFAIACNDKIVLIEKIQADSPGIDAQINYTTGYRVPA